MGAMPGPSKFPDDRLDSLVRSYLEEDSRQVDTIANLRAVQARLTQTHAADVIRLRRQTIRKRVRWVMSIAAVLLAGVGTAYFAVEPTPTSAYSIMSAARAAITPGSDRCYRVEIAAQGNRFKRHPILRNVEGALVWTRGDRFRVAPEPGDGKFAMGQDEAGKFWVVCSDELGLTYNTRELPRMLATVRSLLNLDLEQLTKQFLDFYTFDFEPPGPNDAPDVIVLRAQADPAQPMPIDSAVVTIERRTNVIRKLELSRVVDGVPLGTITFTLVGGQPQADSSYELASHLAEDAKILGRSEAPERAAALRTLLGQ
jgi:hypothetical protein